MRCLGLAMIAACSYEPQPSTVTDGSLPDTSGDSNVTCAWTEPPTGFDPCTLPPPTSELELCTPGTYEYSTTDNTITGGATPATTIANGARVIVLDRLEICADQQLRIVGAMPLVILVHGTVEIAGTLDASAFQLPSLAWQAGPGGDGCTDGNGQPGGNSSAGAGGGPGGGFGAAGGNGGPGDNVAARAGGSAEPSTLSPIRGGCRGGAGGDGDNPGSGGLHGPGGGGLHLAARDAMTIDGRVAASGGPGIGGKQNDAGGGGGGSGGGIFLEASSITITGTVCANGGGGGGGASDNSTAGTDGQPGNCSTTAAAAGSGGTGGGGNAGIGGVGASAAGNGNGGASEGGGGGGGGVGRIRIVTPAPSITGTITPPPS